jgi:hypothetical protein
MWILTELLFVQHFNKIVGLDRIEDCTALLRFTKFRTCASSGNPHGLLPQLVIGSDVQGKVFYLRVAHMANVTRCIGEA